MDKYQSNKIKMFGTASKFLHDHQEKIDSIPRFKDALEEFDEGLKVINEQEVYRNTASEGKTDVKHNAEEEMIIEAINVASSLRAYAAEMKLAELKSIVKISIRKFSRMKEIDLINKCTQIYNEAKKIENALADHGLIPSEIALLKTKIDEYRNSGEKRDSSIADKKGTRINIVDLINELDELIEEKLDSFVNKFVAKDKLFYDGYYAARQIKEYGVRHNKKGEENNEPANVTGQPVN